MSEGTAQGSERLPATRVVEIATAEPATPAELRRQVDEVRAIASASPARFVRRVVFLWFRIFVLESKPGKESRVNIRIPIPLPLVGLLLPHRLSGPKALRALALAQDAAQPARVISGYLDSVMGLEVIRVEEAKAPDRHALVVIGFD